MTKKIDLTGARFGRLLVIQEAGRAGRGEILWLCQCDCGNNHTVRRGCLTDGSTNSCGCLRREAKRTHGMARTALHRIWANMLGRVSNPNIPHYSYYGGRGIRVCDRWRSFENFYADMGPTYVQGLTIDRINNNGHYEPGNCRWATRAEQSANRRNAIQLTYQGRTLVLAQWATKLGINDNTLRNRIRSGWPVDRALTHRVSPERMSAVLNELPQQSVE